jgi:hypothetical protein
MNTMNTPETDQNERPTPETDANASFSIHSHILVPAEFARKLERERDETRELADRYRAAFCSLKEVSVPMPFPWEGGTSPTANPPEKE